MAPAVAGLTNRLRAKVQKARDRQQERFKDAAISCNATIPAGQAFDYCSFDAEAMDRFTEVIESNKVSTRSTNRLAKVARTVADLEASDQIRRSHVNQAKQFVVDGILREVFSGQ